MRCDDSLRKQIRAHLDGFELHRAIPGDHRVAAVAVAVVEEGEGAGLDGIAAPTEWSREAALILTRRELVEEVGLELDPSAVLGRLDDFITRSGFVITPVVVWAGAAPKLVANAAEVASIHRIPVSEFMRADAPWLDHEDDSEQPVLRMPVGTGWIAAPTAAVLYQFRELCIAGRPTRVAHFEQPLFARR
jgi:8-oxo-dGTP pyrophosphatase MutT (NUDIX family)